MTENIVKEMLEEGNKLDEEEIEEVTKIGKCMEGGRGAKANENPT